jgi:hypothetical protein
LSGAQAALPPHFAESREALSLTHLQFLGALLATSPLILHLTAVQNDRNSHERTLTMSEIKLNLIDTQTILHGKIHGSVADAVVAALSAEPETIAELEAALERYIKPVDKVSPFALFHAHSTIDERPWDAGITVVDLAARIVASESTYSQPAPQGQVYYHDGVSATDIPVLYRVRDDWLFLDSIEQYECLREQRWRERVATPPLDARAVLYGQPLLEFIARECLAPTCKSAFEPPDESGADEEVFPDAIAREISDLHARWLMTPRDDLRGQSPRDVLLAEQDFIEFDLHTRSLQWSLLREGPPCLATDSFAYRFAGFGTHEWVIYYDLVRHLIWRALQEEMESDIGIARLDTIKTAWLEAPQPEYGGRIPALLIENERKRLPIAMLGRDMVIDDDCPTCQMMGAETGLGLEVGFWHLDGCNMDQDFVFSNFRTREEWEADRQEWEAFDEKFNREWEERQQRLARGEPVEPLFDSVELEELSGELLDSETPESAS